MAKHMMINIWSRVTVYCMNHDKPVPMQVVKNTELIRSPFYGCSQYIPELQKEGVPLCPNRLNLDDLQGIVQKFSDIIGEDPGADFTNYSFTYRGGRQKTTVCCLKYTDEEIRLGIMNNTVFGK